MIKQIRFLLVIALFAGLNSCVDPDNIRVLEVEDVSTQGFTRLDMLIRVENRGRKASIESGKLNIMRGEISIMDVLLRERVEVPCRTTASIPVSFQMKIGNPLVLFGMGNNPIHVFSSATVSGEFIVKGGVRKKIRFDEMPFPEFLRILGVDSNEIFQL